MTRTYFKLMLPLMLSGVLALLLVRAMPYDDTTLRAFLTPPMDCAAPCFMGIQLGVTTIDEAVVLLEAHEWVRELRHFGRDVSWQWSGQEPDYIDGKRTAWLLGYEGVSSSIKIGTTIRLGDIWLHTSPESSLVFSDLSAAPPFSVYRASSPHYALVFSLDTSCPPESLWRRAVNFTFQQDVDWLKGFDDSPNQFFRICRTLTP